MLRLKVQEIGLAHGEISFSELGGNYTREQIYDYYNECKEYLDEYISNVEVYIKENKYKN